VGLVFTGLPSFGRRGSPTAPFLGTDLDLTAAGGGLAGSAAEPEPERSRPRRSSAVSLRVCLVDMGEKDEISGRTKFCRAGAPTLSSGWLGLGREM